MNPDPVPVGCGGSGPSGGRQDPARPADAWRRSPTRRRDILEESGLTIRLQRLLCVVDHFEPGETPPQHWVSPVFLAEPEGSDNARLMEPQALAAIDWFALDTLPKPARAAAARHRTPEMPLSAKERTEGLSRARQVLEARLEKKEKFNV